ncbi:MAG: cation-translocating P-type ATPase [Elusimicrobia bacterium]|nr:cation-translocating P-type ATPase [Elusimicrobiota bacterium]
METRTTDSPHVGPAELARLGAVAAGIPVLWGLPPSSMAGRTVGLAAAAVGLYPILREALASLLERRMTMELSMAIAVAAALAIQEFQTALVIIVFVLAAEMIEERTVGRGRRAIRDLLEALPRGAVLRRGEGLSEVSASTLRPGDVVVVKPGALLPVDGLVVHGHSFVDESMVTGESVPSEKTPGGRVYAGTVNQSGALEVRTERVGAETAYGRVIRAVEEAERSRAPIQRTADRLAGYLVYFAFGCAALTFAATRDVRATISVIIVTGACGVAAGTPLAILGAIGQAARKGAVIKGGLYLELLARVDTVVFDKTGTLTLGEPHVIDVRPAPGTTPLALLEAAAVGESLSEHPLGKAILRRAEEGSVTAVRPESFRYLPGKGVVCRAGSEEIAIGNRTLLDEHGVALDAFPKPAGRSTEVLVSRGGRLLGAFGVADVPRPEARRAVASLHRLGIRTALLTGDAERVGTAVARELGIDQVEAELLPDGKLRRIDSLMAAGRTVAMVGDGVNDAPALMRAHMGVAMGSGTHVAHESAGVLLLGNDLLRFVDALCLARRCHRIIMANFAGTILVDCIGVAAAALGFIDPMLAAFIHVASELAFILNSARLLPGRPETRHAVLAPEAGHGS